MSGVDPGAWWRPPVTGAAAFIACLLLAASAGAQPRTTCTAPAELVRFVSPLPHAALRLRSGQPLTIVAIGSSSTAGAGASSAATAYPSRLEAELRARFVNPDIRVINKGVGGEIASQMFDRFERDVFAEKPDLVIWQTGTNSVIKGEELTAFGELIRRGIHMARERGIDVILMDLQYAPRVLERPAHREMVQFIAALAREEQVARFRRFALMRHWVQSGQLDFDRMVVPDGLHLNDLSYGCIAGHLAAGIAGAVGIEAAARR